MNDNNNNKEENISNNSPNTKNKFEDAEIEYIQQEIQSMTRKIAKEKINLRILQERYQKKVREYNTLQGKPVTPTKEQKLNILSEKRSKMKQRKIAPSNYGRRVRSLSPEEQTKLIQKNTALNEVKLGDITKGINKQILINNGLSFSIGEIRKDKLLIKQKLDKVTNDNKELEDELNFLQEKNMENLKKLKYQKLEKVKEEGSQINNKFVSDREFLENKYINIMKDNIKRERDKKKELSKKRMMYAEIADKARKEKNGQSKKNTNEIFYVGDEFEIQDRTPILDQLLQKWKYIIKIKKNIINKYINHANEIREAFDRLILYLGVEKYSDLSSVFEREEIKNTNIKEYLAKITDEVDSLENKKNILNSQIKKLTELKISNKTISEAYLKEKKISLEKLAMLNDELCKNINNKRKLFTKLEQKTFSFLKKMEDTYLVDFVVKRVSLDVNLKLTEQNILDFLGSVYCYVQLIKDFNDNVANQKKEISEKMTESSEVNKIIDVLKKDIKFKLTRLSYDYCAKENLFKTIKNGLKHKVVNYLNEDSIKQFATNIANKVNSSPMDFTIKSTCNKRNSQNIRYSINNGEL